MEFNSGEYPRVLELKTEEQKEQERKEGNCKVVYIGTAAIFLVIVIGCCADLSNPK